MAAPLFFLPGVVHAEELLDNERLRPELLRARHLDRVLADVAGKDFLGIVYLSGRGPGGLPGTVICAQPVHGRMPRRLGYYPQEQVWEVAGPGMEDLLWVGIDPTEPPQAEDLARVHQVPGQWVTLGDGGSWLIPVLRRVDNTSELPQEVAFDAQRKATFRIRAAYLEEWIASARSLRLFYAVPDEPPLSSMEAAERALAILTINYRFDWFLQNRLQVLDRDRNVGVLGASVDLPMVSQLMAELATQKKTASAASPATEVTLPGSPDSCPTTDPAEASCSSPPPASADPVPV